MRPSWILIAVFSLVGCTSIGPATVPRDRFDYTSAVAESWQRQLLLNMVKIRYGDTPMFVDVGQIVSGYTLQSTVSVSGNLYNTQGFSPGTTVGSVGAGAQGQFTDRPTITYTPLTGEQFARQLLSPIPPAAVSSPWALVNAADASLWDRCATRICRPKAGARRRASRRTPGRYTDTSRPTH